MENNFPENVWFCSECGTKNDTNARFCKSCGKQRFVPNPAPNPAPAPVYTPAPTLVYTPAPVYGEVALKKENPARKVGLIIALIGLAFSAVCVIAQLDVTITSISGYADMTVSGMLGWEVMILLAISGIGYIIAGASSKRGLHITAGVFLLFPLLLDLFALCFPNIIMPSLDAFLVFSYSEMFVRVLYLLFLSLAQFKVNIAVAVIILISFILRLVDTVWSLVNHASYYEFVYSSKTTYIVFSVVIAVFTALPVIAPAVELAKLKKNA